MKKLIDILFIAVVMCVVSSCRKDSFLDRQPLSAVTPQTFFNTEGDLQIYCNQYYAWLPVQYLVSADLQSDDKAPQSLNTMLAGTYTVPQKDPDNYDSAYAHIRAVNFFMMSYQKANISDSIKNIYVGESLFFRAMQYFNLVKTYSDVQYITRYLTDTSKSLLYGSKTPHQQIMDSVLTDLNTAISYLPLSPSQDGRLSKYQALALKARVALWEGTYRKYYAGTDGTTYLQAATDAAEQLMNSKNYSIYSTGNPQSDYYNLFIQDELKGNPEAIMSMRFMASANTYNNVDRQLGESGDGYSKDFVRSYLCTDGLPTGLSPLYKGDDSLGMEIINRDPRIKQTIATRGFNFLNGDLITLPRVGTNVTSTGYQPIKGRSSSISAWNANNSTFDFFIFRYAETLLIEAEARAELGTCTQDVLDNTINKLRDRAGMPHMTLGALQRDPQSHFPNVPVLIDEIRRERRIELATEGFRFDDLHRWKAGTLINNNETMLGMKLLPAMRAQYTYDVSNVRVNSDYYVQPYAIPSRTWNDKMYLLPIPLQQMNLNPNLAPQNTGW
ncbi:RagB/SusD family nutrient uptake outer membrane protein [Chitinophaga sp. Cy-1792]|uniref:RagB/SusD family nutrient uptake outer membrane protein n=1 Tax=Chitinophaga sp. Cy-1792 TaxID=2608339 RepID=UPI00141E2B13|nr:RagB/SusD family nutrient uptake outer membrane protein [Chitinophaga sp. Cy-1792]NIG56754.1 RagB/SusD family nutrient uptake outer membrane protein [Chitinophaga sp. Cy-1792]